MEDKKYRNIGGNIESSLQGHTKLDLKVIAKEAWILTQTAKSGLLQGSVIVVALSLLLVMLLQNIFNVEDWATAPPRVRLMLQISVTVITAPVVAALFMLGMSHGVGEKPSFPIVLKRVINSAVVILIALLVSFLVDLGFTLFLLPGIYLGFATGFSMMLYIEKQLPPSQAIIQSIKIFNRYWLPLTGFYVATFLLFLIGMLTFGFAYIWIIPFYFNVKGVLYRELFGIRVTMMKNDKDDYEGDTLFDA